MSQKTDMTETKKQRARIPPVVMPGDPMKIMLQLVAGAFLALFAGLWIWIAWKVWRFDSNGCTEPWSFRTPSSPRPASSPPLSRPAPPPCWASRSRGDRDGFRHGSTARWPARLCSLQGWSHTSSWAASTSSSGSGTPMRRPTWSGPSRSVHSAGSRGRSPRSSARTERPAGSRRALRLELAEGSANRRPGAAHDRRSKLAIRV
jgi:hypothetical protein